MIRISINYSGVGLGCRGMVLEPLIPGKLEEFNIHKILVFDLVLKNHFN